MECSHLLDNVKADGVLAAKSTITKNFSCSVCETKDQTWLCLACGAMHCGRYVNAHAKLHAEDTHHHICMSCDVYSVYCYKCDDYVSNDTENGAINKIRQSIMSVCKTEEEISNTEEECKDLEGVKPETLSNNEEVDVAPASSCNDVPLTNSTTDVSETKPSKTTKAEEPARSLRSRSRKRSHSEDSGSTENSSNSTTPVKKDKKSPCNGKTQREKKILGLKNLGNTCFMNAVLQSLNNIQEFSCYFSQLPSLEVKSNGRKVYHSRSYTRQEVNEVVMAEELRKVLINLNGGCGGKGAISPEYLFHVIWKVVPRFRGYQQQDAHEFLRYMLDRLHTELLQLVPAELQGGAGAGAGVGGAVPRPRSASIVTAVFGGTLQSEVRCLSCGTESKKLDPFLDLSLELPDTGRHDEPVPLTECLSSFVQVEELADTERYFCSSCKCKQKSTKQFYIRRLPNVLCLHLKRFRWHNNYRNKVDTTISFPLSSLDMSGFVPNNVPDTRRSRRGNLLYDLAAVIVHHGSGAASGHYTAYAINEDQWFHFNDQTVRPAPPQAVASCKPYILFYIRRELTLNSTS